MPKRACKAPGGHVFHVRNRAVGRMRLFRTGNDFEAFRRVMIEAHQRHPARILVYCFLSNHWHVGVCRKTDRQVTDCLVCAAPVRQGNA